MNENANDKHSLLNVEANECPLSTNTDPVEGHTTFTKMRNKPLHQSEKRKRDALNWNQTKRGTILTLPFKSNFQQRLRRKA